MLHGDLLTSIAKLQAASGIDPEDIADGARLQCNSEVECTVLVDLHTYGTTYGYAYQINPAGDRIKIRREWYPLDDKAKALLLRDVIVSCMRATPREKVIKQWKSSTQQQLAAIKNTIENDAEFRAMLEPVFKPEKK
jgi:hypothetical protein